MTYKQVKQNVLSETATPKEWQDLLTHLHIMQYAHMTPNAVNLVIADKKISFLLQFNPVMLILPNTMQYVGKESVVEKLEQLAWDTI